MLHSIQVCAIVQSHFCSLPGWFYIPSVLQKAVNMLWNVMTKLEETFQDILQLSTSETSVQRDVTLFYYHRKDTKVSESTHNYFVGSLA